MNRLDDAEKHLMTAVSIRDADAGDPNFNAALSRESLAVVYEMRGDLVAAKHMRRSTGKFACGNYENGVNGPIQNPSNGLSLMFVVTYSVRDEFSIRVGSDNVPSALYVLFSSRTFLSLPEQ